MRCAGRIHIVGGGPASRKLRSSGSTTGLNAAFLCVTKSIFFVIKSHFQASTEQEEKHLAGILHSFCFVASRQCCIIDVSFSQ